MRLLILILFVLVMSVGGCIAGTLLSGKPGRKTPWFFFPLVLFCSLGLWICVLCLYARSAGLPFTPAALFPDRLSKLLLAWLLLPISVLVGFVLGCIRARGMRGYFRSSAGSRLHRAVFGGVCVVSLTLALAGMVLADKTPPSPLRISEACCCNFGLKKDPNTDEYEDYIELRNTGDAPLEVGGYFLSDRVRKRSRFRLPDATLEPGEYLLLWADGTGKSGKAGENGLSLNFTLDPGETVYLTSPHGILLDSVTLPEEQKNISINREDEEWILANGSPGYGTDIKNTYIPATLAAPTANYPSGFYDGPIELRLSAEPGCVIRYTTDGSEPTEKDPVFPDSLTLADISSEPNRVLNHPTTTLDRSGVITDPVDKGTLIRAIAFDASGARSELFTAVYFVGAETFSKYSGRVILNITADPLDLFGNYGICVTGLAYDRWEANGKEGARPYPFFYRRGPATERDADLMMWDETGRMVMQDVCGIRLQGDHTRAAVFKRFRLISRTLYSGSDTFSASIFGDSLSHSFFTRQDSADLIAQKLAEGLELGGLDAIPAAVFVNGEFYYYTYLRERYDKQYFVNHFGVEANDLIVISNDALDVGTEEDYAEYRALTDFIAENDCSDPAVYREICERMDVRNYAEYVALNIYCNNTDWSIYKNYKLWRTRSTDGEGVCDGRWRWLVYDMDGCTWAASKYGVYKAKFDAFQIDQPYTKVPFLEMPVFSDLLKNPDFRVVFANAWLDLMNVYLTEDRGRQILEQYGLVKSDKFWLTFLRNRPVYATDILISDLGLSGSAYELTVQVNDPAGGTVRVNAVLPDLSSGSWTGTYVTDVPVTLRAEASPGWHFVRWENLQLSISPTTALLPGGDTAVTAVFEPDAD